MLLDLLPLFNEAERQIVHPTPVPRLRAIPRVTPRPPRLRGRLVVSLGPLRVTNQGVSRLDSTYVAGRARLALRGTVRPPRSILRLEGPRLGLRPYAPHSKHKVCLRIEHIYKVSGIGSKRTASLSASPSNFVRVRPAWVRDEEELLLSL